MNVLKSLRIATSRRCRSPLFLILFVTSRCNSRCKHCFYWRNLNSPSDELTLQEVEELSGSFEDIYSLAISGGEPFLREDLDLICELFCENNHVKCISIPTNGLLPSEIGVMTEKILRRCVNAHVTLVLSIDGPARIHDEFRGVSGSFDKALQTYAILKELKRSHSNLSVQVSSTICNQTCQFLGELSGFVRDRMPEVDKHAVQLLRGETKDAAVQLPPLKEIVQLHTRLRGGKDSGKGFVDAVRRAFNARFEHYFFELQMEILKEAKQAIPCVAGEAIGVVAESGYVRFCELLEPVGNIRDSGFARAWNSSAAAKQRELIRNGKCFCTHECFLYPSIIFSPTLGVWNLVQFIVFLFKNLKWR